MKRVKTDHWSGREKWGKKGHEILQHEAPKGHQTLQHCILSRAHENLPTIKLSCQLKNIR